MKKGKKIIVANWKMNPVSAKEAVVIFKGIAITASKLKKIQTVIAPSFIHVGLLAEKKSKAVTLGVQNIFSEQKGSFTGEVSVDMVKNSKITHVIIGHSERRKLGETNESINKKVQLALQNKLIPIVCIGEVSRDEEGKYLSVIKEQLEKAFAGVARTSLSKIIVAYEPVWAIGASVAMDAHDIHQMSIYIKKSIIDIYKSKTLDSTPILYGGAVDPTNAKSILSEGEVDGLLIGRVSLDPKAFSEILKIANTL
ncbi:MAG: triose-phosphate isomerase [bacterium]|nr:triose-phosphate isomerase [bacterium]